MPIRVIPWDKSLIKTLPEPYAAGLVYTISYLSNLIYNCVGGPGLEFRQHDAIWSLVGRLDLGRFYDAVESSAEEGGRPA